MVLDNSIKVPGYKPSHAYIVGLKQWCGAHILEITVLILRAERCNLEMIFFCASISYY